MLGEKAEWKEKDNYGGGGGQKKGSREIHSRGSIKLRMTLRRSLLKRKKLRGGRSEGV